MSLVNWKQDYFNKCFSSFWNSYEDVQKNSIFKLLFS